MTPERARKLLEDTGAIIDGHFVGTSGSHMSVYVAKDRATRFPSIASELCLGIAEMFATDDIEAVVGQGGCGTVLSQWTAHHLTLLRPDKPEVLALYSEHGETVLYDYKNDISLITRPDFSDHGTIRKNDKLILRRADLILKRGFEDDVRSKRVLVLEDVLTTGESAAKTINAVVFAGGMVVGLGAIVNGGNFTTETFFPVLRPVLKSLVDLKRGVFTEKECRVRGLCAGGVPVNTKFGHGQEFLARRNK